MAKKKTDGADGTNESPDMVTVRVTGQRISEMQGCFAKGETFQTTAERAEALDDLVEIVPDVAE